MPNPRSVVGLLINEGIFGGSAGEPDQVAIDGLRRSFSDATNALDQCDRDHRFSASDKSIWVWRRQRLMEQGA